MKISNSTSDLSSYSLSSTITKEGQNKRSSLKDALHASLHSARGLRQSSEAKQTRDLSRGSSVRSLKYNTNSNSTETNDGLVANRRRQITRRLSMDTTIITKQSTTAPKRLNASKSMDSAMGSELDLNDLPSGSSHTRFSALRERFNSSNASLNMSSVFDSSFSTLGDSAHLTNSVHSSIPEIGADSDDEYDSDDDSINSFGEEEDESEACGSFHMSRMNSTRSIGMNSLMSGDLEEHEAGLQKLLDMEHSFNQSFLTVGGSGKDCRHTRKGSVYVMADAKLANTKIVKNKLEKAARTIQRFFRHSKAILSRVRDEVDYWTDEKNDIERRRKEELEDVQRFLEIQKQQFALQLEQEEIRKYQDQLDANHKLVAELEESVQVEKDENEKLKESIRTLTHQNKKIKSEVEDPIRADKVSALESDILSLTASKEQREAIVAQATKTVKLFHLKIKVAEKQTGVVRSQRQLIKECLRKIIKLVDANLEKFAADAAVMEVMHTELSKINPKLAKKVKKRMEKATEEVQSRSSIQSQKEEACNAEASGNKTKSRREAEGVVLPENKSRSLPEEKSASTLQSNGGESSALLSLISTSEHSSKSKKKSKTPRRSSSLHSALEKSKSSKEVSKTSTKSSSSLKAALAAESSSSSKESSESKKKRSSSSTSSKKKKKSSRSMSQPEGSMALMSLITGDTNDSGDSSAAGGGGALMSLIQDSSHEKKKSESKRKSKSKRSSIS